MDGEGYLHRLKTTYLLDEPKAIRATLPFPDRRKHEFRLLYAISEPEGAVQVSGIVRREAHV